MGCRRSAASYNSTVVKVLVKHVHCRGNLFLVDAGAVSEWTISGKKERKRTG